MITVGLIEKKLSSVDTDERRAAVLSLKGKSLLREGDLTGADAMGLLLKAMRDPSWRVRKTAQDMLFDEYAIDSYMDGLIALLYIEDNAGARNAAIETLTRLDKLSTPYLIKAFDTPNADVRKFIIDVLGQFRDKRALQLMLSALKDEDENVRASAVEHLGAIGDASVVDALVGILEEGDLWTAYPAADALGRIGDRKAIPALVRALERKTLREPALRAIGRIGDSGAIKDIVPFIEDKSKVIAEEAIKAIEALYHKGVSEEAISLGLRSQFGDRTIELLLKYAWSERPDVRVPAIFLLGLMKDERALDPLLDLSSEADFAEDVKKALVYIGRERPDSLLPLFERDTPSLRRFVCAVAAEVASPIYSGIFLKLIGDPDGHVRALSARGLANIGDRKAISALSALLEDEYVDVQEAAISALGAMREGLDMGGLIAGLADKNPLLRKNTALLLGAIAPEEAVPALGFALKDDNAQVRRAVIGALSSIKNEASIKYLMVALTDEDPNIRASAALSLGSLGIGAERESGEATAIESLSLLLSDPDDRVKAAAARALGILGDERAVPSLIKTLTDPNGFVVTTAVDSIGRLGGESAKEALLGLLSHTDREIIRTAIMSLSAFAGVEERVIPFLRDEDWATRVAAVEALGPLNSDSARPALELLFDEEEDPVVRKTLQRYLK